MLYVHGLSPLPLLKLNHKKRMNNLVSQECSTRGHYPNAKRKFPMEFQKASISWGGIMGNQDWMNQKSAPGHGCPLCLLLMTGPDFSFRF